MTSGWFAVRCVFRFDGASDDGASGSYEERITLWQARSVDEAIERAEAGARRYLADIDEPPSAFLGLAQCYALHDEPADGAEVFSLIRDSPLAPDDYLNTFFDTGSERQSHS